MSGISTSNSTSAKLRSSRIASASAPEEAVTQSASTALSRSRMASRLGAWSSTNKMAGRWIDTDTASLLETVLEDRSWYHRNNQLPCPRCIRLDRWIVGSWMDDTLIRVVSVPLTRRVRLPPGRKTGRTWRCIPMRPLANTVASPPAYSLPIVR